MIIGKDKMVPLTCRFCGKQTGSLYLENAQVGTMVNPEDLHLADTRCDACQDEHGVYKEMHDVFLRDIEDNHDKFKEVIHEAGHSIGKFVERMTMMAPERMVGVASHDYPAIEKHRVRIVKDLGIEHLDAHDRAAFIRHAQGDKKFSHELTSKDLEGFTKDVLNKRNDHANK